MNFSEVTDLEFKFDVQNRQRAVRPFDRLVRPGNIRQSQTASH